MWTILLFLCAVFVQSGARGEKDDRNKRNETILKHCPSEWTENGQRCYLHVSAPKNWVGAEQHCLGLGANLASVHSLDEYTFLQQLVSSNSHPVTWIGGTDAFQNRVWFWSDGSLFHYSAWAAGEPNNAGGREPCIAINWGDDHKWNDAPCHLRLGFICSFKL
ncbi:ladderlectin-like [Hypomesus transpacificus]|uniref:ladderlectin-like n=1 Tax=Hypomesus transpacificus TaxID=137520 RepID=UPI001F085B75|nr:ladderlectin-like [Hypomesus transpacificus]